MDGANSRGTSVTGDLKGPKVADYADEGEIARGGQGQIRRVADSSLLRSLAMKVLDPSLTGEEVHRKRFVEEAQITAQLDHPNIPPVHRLGIDDDGRFYFTMKLLRGKTLEDVLSLPTFSPSDLKELMPVLQILVTICNAVAFAHGRGVVHRDLKPENIMVADHGQVYVMDWGIARIIGAARPSGQDQLPAIKVWGAATNENGTIAGTPEYMAPEQALGLVDDIDERTDVFALGAILYRVLTGRAPYHSGSLVGSIARATLASFEPPAQAAPDRRLPSALCAIVMRAMNKDPNARYQSVDAFRQDIEAYLRFPAELPLAQFAAGEQVIREGDTADAAYVIMKGRARVYKTVNGQKVPLRELGPSAAFGEAAIFSAQKRTASVEAIDQLTVTIVTRQSLEEELGHASIVAPLVRELASRFRDVDRELTNQRMDTTRSAMARAALVYIAMHGVASSPNQRSVVWSSLCLYLMKTFGCSPEEATTSIKAMPEARLDLIEDFLHLEQR